MRGSMARVSSRKPGRAATATAGPLHHTVPGAIHWGKPRRPAPRTPGCTTIGTVIAARAGQAGSPLDGGGAVLQLYSYFRSSASYRVRIALNLKGLDYETVAVHLLKGEQRAEGFLAVNPAGRVPALVEEGKVFTQSLAPGDAADRARIRALAQTIACEIHPLNNLAVLNYLEHALGVDEEARNAWYRHWVEQGLAAMERLLADPRTGAFCHGDTPTLADCCLVPQVFNARRFACRLDHVPTVLRIHERCMALPAFQRAAPDAQPDAE